MARKKLSFKIKISALAAAMSVLFLTGCPDRETVDLPTAADYELDPGDAPRKELKVGVVPGPYGDMFMEALYPLLQKAGYTAELVYYDDYTLPNFALAGKQTDLNMFQHYRYLVSHKFEHDLSLSAIAEIPTVSMGVYSLKYRSLNDLNGGAAVCLPEDRTNFARALMFLEDAGIIKLDRTIDKTKAAVYDVIFNPHDIRLVPLSAHTLVQSLPGCDLAVINGNFALSGGLNLADALYNERLEDDYFNVIAVRTEDLGERFVEDIIRALRSDDFRAAIMHPNGKFNEFQRPLSFYKNIH